jgi:hypothetical protein
MLPPELDYKIIELAGCEYSGFLVLFVGMAAFSRPPGEARLHPLECGVHGYCVCVRASFERAPRNTFFAPLPTSAASTNPAAKRRNMKARHGSAG